jgi:hypothetical protein
MAMRAFRQRERTTVAIHSAPSADTSVSRAHRLLPKASKNRLSVALSRPGAAQMSRPLSWSTITVRYRWPFL